MPDQNQNIIPEATETQPASPAGGYGQISTRPGASIEALLDEAIEKNASDLHLIVGVAPTLRIDGKLVVISNQPKLDDAKCEELIKSVLTQDKNRLVELDKEREIDFSFGYREMRFRANIYYERGNIAGEFRLIPSKIRSIAELGLPPILEKFTTPSQGFVIVTGPTGHGKSTTIASLIETINKNQAKTIITIEDPIEYVFEHKKGIISQREVGGDTLTFDRGLRAALREDPNVVFVGEMRDLETTRAALTIAETGHLVFTTLHTNDAAQTADRIVDIFPPHQQPQVRQQFASVLLGIISQRLLPKVSGGRMVACEILIANSAVRNLIREGKSHQIPSVIQTAAAEGMVSLDKVLAELISRGEITIDTALDWAQNPRMLKTMIY